MKTKLSFAAYVALTSTAITLAYAMGSIASAAPGQVSIKGPVVGFSPTGQAGPVDYLNAKAMPLPTMPDRSDAQLKQDLINAVTKGKASASPGFRQVGKATAACIGWTLASPILVQRAWLTWMP